jgi:hypothetical protein
MYGLWGFILNFLNLFLTRHQFYYLILIKACIKSVSGIGLGQKRYDIMVLYRGRRGSNMLKMALQY